MDYPLLSVIIPSFNQGQYIERTLLSILKQDYPGEVQVIVADGGSSDNTVEILKKYPQIDWWSKPDKGFVDAVNQAFAVAQGEIIAIQSSDDFYLQDAFKVSVRELLKEDNLKVVAGCDIYLQPDMTTFYLSQLDNHEITPESLLLQRLIPQHCAFFKRTILDKIDGLRSEVDTCADTDLWYRALHFFRGKFIPYYTGVYQFHKLQRSNVLPDWASSLRKMVELCEEDYCYNSQFKLSQSSKKDLEIIWDFCYRKEPLDETDIDSLQKAIKQEVKSQKILDKLNSILWELQQYKYHETSICKKIKLALRDGSFTQRFLTKTNEILGIDDIDTEINNKLDLEWWR